MSSLHYNFITLFKRMNERLPTQDNGNHYWADPSRELIKTIEITLGLYNALKSDELAFTIDDYYFNLIRKCRDFLSSSGGSLISPHMDKIDLYYTLPIFVTSNTVTTNNPQATVTYTLKQIGSGSYANVYKYKDTFYNKFFVVKRAKKDLNEKELKRFKQEYEEMKEFSSPYILEVYRYNEANNEYYIEYMDYSLDSYIQKNNTSLSISERKNIVNQILRAFDYIHQRKRLHRDISPKNILLKEYHDTLVVKIADFGLVKVPDSTLTSVNTEFKGYFNDPSLIVDGFSTYGLLHENYALTTIIFYVMTGKTNISSLANKQLNDFINKGLNIDKTKRFQSISEMIMDFRMIK